jgi:hypothetical protein
MENYKFHYNDKEYELGERNCSGVLNDEEHPVRGIDRLELLELLNQQEIVDFDIEYYDQPCEKCLSGENEKSNYFKFLEYHFFIYTKKGEYVSSSISKDDENMTFHKLLKKGIVDNSYIVSVAVCVACGEYFIEIEQCEV